MLKYLFLCGFFALSLYWIEPLIRGLRETVPQLAWLPDYDARIWENIGAVLLAGTVIAGIIFIIKLALYLWREVYD
ncbi:hypothetical protein [Roseomonas marmotae]|uniref:Uncharacterized protein n=1 Tax=Roseomonas marmotae TaxID=2768161 RepID=A0ABS3KAB8_9PROT|nr:hypothetical protein [Roseomonas marmotae]MBO1074396.1 hypothetical protein [Roseomonas marmotae]QTI78137.1 hypothetical protein IAI58_10460 [Roseomonas marmotae]